MTFWQWMSSTMDTWSSLMLVAAPILLALSLRVSRLAKVVLLAIVLLPPIAFGLWRTGRVVAEAEFNPGIAPFHLTVWRVPVPVTQSSHFIVELKRGQYVVTSFRYFWPQYTPQRVKIGWDKIEHFTVTFDDNYVATCDWSWGKEAIWRMSGPPGGVAPGLSATYFTPVDPNAHARIWQ
jgi:hypothetical protein